MIINLTALRVSPQKNEDSPVPRVQSINTDEVFSVIRVTNDVTGAENIVVKIGAPRVTKTIRAAEKYGEFLLLQDFTNSASSPLNNGVRVNVAASGAGAAASATSLTAAAYFNAVTAATVSTMTGIRLPNASGAASYGQPKVILNAASTSIIVFPAASETLNSTTAGAVTISPGRFKTFYAPVTSGWVECRGPVYS